MPSLVGQRGCAGCRCRTGALALPRLTGIPHSQFSRRLKQRLQTGRSSPHFTLRRRQVLQPVRCESVSQSTIVRPLGSFFFPSFPPTPGNSDKGWHTILRARRVPTRHGMNGPLVKESDQPAGISKKQKKTADITDFKRGAVGDAAGKFIGKKKFGGTQN